MMVPCYRASPKNFYHQCLASKEFVTAKQICISAILFLSSIGRHWHIFSLNVFLSLSSFLINYWSTIGWSELGAKRNFPVRWRELLKKLSLNLSSKHRDRPAPIKFPLVRTENPKSAANELWFWKPDWKIKSGWVGGRVVAWLPHIRRLRVQFRFLFVYWRMPFTFVQYQWAQKRTLMSLGCTLVIRG